MDEKCGPSSHKLSWTKLFPYLLLLLVGTVKAVHAYRADLDGLSQRLADPAPDTTRNTKKQNSKLKQQQDVSVRLQRLQRGVRQKTHEAGLGAICASRVI